MGWSTPYGYNGDPKLKRAGIELDYDAHKIAELKKCKNDPEYFLSNYIHINAIDEGRILFQPRDYQLEFIDAIEEHNHVILNQSRQSGKTTIVIGYVIWYTLFHKHADIAMLANKGDTARKLLAKFRKAYRDLPLWMQVGVIEANKHTIEFENDVKVYTAATNENAVRGDTVSLCIVDEAAWIDDNMWQEFLKATWPTISSGKSSKFVLISTPRGMNHFFQIWKKAQQGQNTFFPIEVKWDRIPGRTKEWKEKEISNVGEIVFMQEYDLIFTGSADTLIDIKTLTAIDTKLPIDISYNGNMLTYEAPQSDRKYVACVDVAKGVGLDYSIVSVIDVTDQANVRQVALYRNNTMSYPLFSGVCNSVAKYYNNAILIIENNELGEAVAYILDNEYEYPNIYNPDSSKDSGAKYTTGVRMNKKIKRLGCSHIKDIIESKKLTIVDNETLNELSNFGKSKDSYEALVGHDDIVMTLVMFGWLCKQNNFIEELGYDLLDDVYSPLIEQLVEEQESLPDPIIADEAFMDVHYMDGNSLNL